MRGPPAGACPRACPPSGRGAPGAAVWGAHNKGSAQRAAPRRLAAGNKVCTHTRTANTHIQSTQNTQHARHTRIQGDYDYFLSKNEDEAEKMEAKDAKAAAIEEGATKAKSKMTKAEKERLKKVRRRAPRARVYHVLCGAFVWFFVLVCVCVSGGGARPS